MKKILLVLMALCLLVPLGAISASAAEKVFPPTNVNSAEAFAKEVKDMKNGGTIKLTKSFTVDGGEIGKDGVSYTIDLNGYILTTTAAFTVTKGTVKVTGASGEMVGKGCNIFEMNGGSVKLSGGKFTTDPLSEQYHVAVNKGEGILYLAGKLTLQQHAFQIYNKETMDAEGYERNQEKPVTIECAWDVQKGDIIVKNAKTEDFYFAGYDNSKFSSAQSGDDVVIAPVAYVVWAADLVLIIIACIIFFAVAGKTKKMKRKYKKDKKAKKENVGATKMAAFFTPFIAPIFSMLGISCTDQQELVLFIALILLVAAILFWIISACRWSKWKKEAKAAEKKAAAERQAKKAQQAVARAAREEQKVVEREEQKAAAAVAEQKEHIVVNVVINHAPVTDDEPAPEPVEVPVAEVIVKEPVAASEPEPAPAEEVEATPVVIITAEEPVEEPAEEPVEEPAEEPVEEPAEEPVEEPAEEDDLGETDEAPLGEETAAVAAAEAGSEFANFSSYKKSFLARVSQSDDEVQQRYSQLRNALLRYKKVTSRISWSYDSIKQGRIQLAKFAVTGKTLCLFLALDPATLEGTKYNVVNAGDTKKYEDVPCRLRLTSKRSVKWGLELIALLAEKNGLVENPKYEDQDFALPFKTTNELIDQNLIKKI